MRARNPRLDQSAELLSALEEFSRFSGCGNLYPGVVDHIPLAPASIEEQHQSVGLFSECEASAFKAESMMPWNSRDTISRAGCRHPRYLQCGVIRCCESTVLRKRRKSCISQVPLDYSAQLIEFLLARLVRVNLPRGEQSLPTHSRFLSTLFSYFSVRSVKSGSSQ